MILHSFRKQAAIFRFDRRYHHSSLPAKTKAPVALNSGSIPLPAPGLVGMLPRVRIYTSSQPDPRTLTKFAHAKTTTCLIALLILSVTSFVAFAGKAKSIGTAGSNTWAFYIAEAAQRFSVPVHWIRAVMQQESNADTTAVSPKGAMG